MAENTENTTTVIRKNDPNFPEYFDFDVLRKEGLNHIGNLSGKIWTDHNLHDPGITILETLCFALIDLGYRSRLPIEDLLTINQDALEDNFFTPDQILTCNPLTIIDYRKMLIEIDGVRNAWLEVSEDEKFELSCDNIEVDYFLNGVYKVLLELDSERIEQLQKTKPNIEITKKIKTEAQKRLHAHRNLAEDFDCKIEILEPLPMAICGEIILTNDAEIEEVFREIAYKIQQFFSPDVPFYTLQDLLEKGKPIENIFAGRPLFDESRGFIDTDELAEMQRHKTICLSDIYHIILAIKGVRAANDLKLCTCKGGSMGDDAWEFSLDKDKNQVPTLSTACLSLKFNKNGVKKLPTEKEKNQWIGESFHHRKAPLSKKYLDLTAPKGVYRNDLGNYYSIQHEFPRVYGIGDNELPDSASDARKAKALQLQGYLLFYDQILADYAMQMANLRTLFSMRADADRTPQETHTYFSANLATIPKIEKLVRLYQQSYSDFGWNDGTTVARLADRAKVESLLFDLKKTETGISKNFLKNFKESYLFSVAALRDSTAEQLRRDIDQDEAVIEIYEDECGFFFFIKFSSEDVLLLSTDYFSTEKKANEVAYTVLVLATLVGNYREVNRQDAQEYVVDLIFRSHNYLDSLQEITESEATYNVRREGFLNHLLGRFQETFNDYALLAYTKTQAANSTKKNKVFHTQNEEKARFLSKYDQISRNRGRAFDYLIDGWNSPNVSGFEQRIASLANFNDALRRDLCHFEVVNCGDEFEILVKNYADENILQVTQTFSSQDEAKGSLEKLLLAAQKPENYVRENDTNKCSYKIAIRTNDVEAFYPKVFLDETERDNKLIELQRTFRREATDEDIFVSKSSYFLRLHQNDGDVFDTSIPHENEKLAWQKKSAFLTKQKALILHENPAEKHTYLNVETFKKTIFQLPITFKWQLEKYNYIESSEQEYFSESDALDHFINNISVLANDLENEWFEEQTAVHWQLKNGKNVLLESTQLFADNRKASIAFINAKKSNKYEIFATSDNKKCIFWLNEAGVKVAKSPEFSEDATAYIEQVREAFAKTKKVTSFAKIERSFLFQITDNEGVKILSSYHHYPTKREAVEQIFQVVALAKNANAFYKSGDESNLNFSFQLRAEDGQFLAEHSQIYDNDEERNQSLQNTLDFFEKYKFPLAIIQQDDRFSYRWKDENEAQLLMASRHFPTPKEAENDFYLMLHQSTQMQNFEETKTGFLLKNEREIIAIINDDSSINRIVDLVKQQQYFLKLEIRPAEWKFRYWQSADTQLESIEAFGLVEKAAKAYQDFAKNLANFKVNKLDIISQKNKKVLAKIITTNDTPESIINIDKKLTINGLYQSNSLNFIQKTPICQQGSLVFHVLKKDPSLAYHPKRFFSQKSIEKENEIKQKLSNICHQKFDYFEICLGGEVVIEKKYAIDCQWITKYHFVIRQRHSNTILFISYERFDTYEDAAQAFEEQYLILLRIALSIQNYGTLILKNFENYDYSKEQNCSNQKPIAFLGDDARTYDEYVAIAAHYPIRLTGKKHKFQVVDSATLEVAWRSTLSYDSPQEAMAAFKVFLAVLQYKCSCRLCFDEERCFYLPVINEILLVSKNRFQEEKDAWLALEKMLKNACREDAFYRYENPLRRCCESFWLVDDDFAKNIKNEVFDSERACVERIKEKYNENHHCHKIGDCGPYVIQEWDECKILAYHPQCYESGFEVNEAINRTRACLNHEGMHLMEHILLRPKQVKRSDLQFLTHAEKPKCQIETSPDCSCNGLVWELDTTECGESRNISVAPCADPYSFWVTLVLPCWTCRFSDPQFRVLFENMLHREAPAHIALNVRWVSAWQMCEFEGHYKQWIKSLKYKCEEKKIKNCLENPCDFIDSLNKIVGCEANQGSMEEKDDCPCKEVIIVDDSTKKRFDFFNDRQKINKDLIKKIPITTINKESIKKLNAQIVGHLDITFQPLMLALSKENSKVGFAINEHILLGILDNFAFKNTEIGKEDTEKLEAVMKSLNKKIDPCKVIEKWLTKELKECTNRLIVSQLQRIVLG